MKSPSLQSLLTSLVRIMFKGKAIIRIKLIPGTSLVIQWLRLCAFNVGGMGSIPGQGTTIPRVRYCGGGGGGWGEGGGKKKRAHSSFRNIREERQLKSSFFFSHHSGLQATFRVAEKEMNYKGHPSYKML